MLKFSSRPCRAVSLAVSAWCAALAAGTATAQDTNIVEVQHGDTFSGIAARFEGEARHWRRLYDARLSRLPDPNLIMPGMRFELVTEASGKRYLRLISGGTHTAAAPSPAPAPAAAPSPAPAAPRPPAVAAAPAPAPAPAAAPAPPPAATPAPAVPAPVPAPAAAASSEPLVVGVLPNVGAAALMSQYENVKSYFERRGGQKVNIVLPANFKAFFDAMMRGDYDVAVAAPHFARVAQVDAGMVPLAMYEPRIGAQFIAPIDSTITGPADVRGKPVAFANPTSLVAMYGQQWLRQNKLEPGKDYEVIGARTDVGVGRLLLSGEAVAAVMSNGEFRALPPDEASRLRIIDVFARIPNFIVVAHPRLGAARIATLKTQWLGLLGDKDEGAAFAKSAGLAGIVEPDPAVLRELDAYVAPTRRIMGVTK